MDDLISRQALRAEIERIGNEMKFPYALRMTLRAVVEKIPSDDGEITKIIEYYRKKCRSYEDTIFKLTNIINQLNRRMEEDEREDDA